MPLPSPTTTRAVKLNLRPPCTTLATRLIVTTRSRYAVPFSGPAPRRSSRRSRRSPPPPAPRRGVAAIRSSSSVVGCGLPRRPLLCSLAGYSIANWSADAASSQGQPAFARAIGQRGHPAVICVATTVEDCRANAGLPGSRREQRSNLLRLGRLVASHSADRFIKGRRRSERNAQGVVDELGKRVLGRARDHQPRPRSAALDLLADTQVSPLPRGDPRGGAASNPAVCPGLGARHFLLTSLPDLAADLFALVPHALALIGVRLAKLADIRGHFAHLLLVDALHHKPGGSLNPEGDPGRRSHGHGVAEPQCELQVLALGLDAVSDADNLHGFAVALGHAGHHIGDQRPGQAVQRADLTLVAGPGHSDDAVGLLDLDRRGHFHAQLALRAFDVHLPAVDVHIDTARDDDRQPSNSRHS